MIGCSQVWLVHVLMAAVSSQGQQPCPVRAQCSIPLLPQPLALTSFLPFLPWYSLSLGGVDINILFMTGHKKTTCSLSLVCESLQSLLATAERGFSEQSWQRHHSLGIKLFGRWFKRSTSCVFSKTTAVASPLGPMTYDSSHGLLTRFTGQMWIPSCKADVKSNQKAFGYTHSIPLWAIWPGQLITACIMPSGTIGEDQRRENV